MAEPVRRLDVELPGDQDVRWNAEILRQRLNGRRILVGIGGERFRVRSRGERVTVSMNAGRLDGGD